LKRISFGILRLKPQEFWELTLLEIGEMLEAVYESMKQEDELEWFRTAWFTAHIMNSSGNYKKAIQPNKLLGKSIETEADEDNQKVVTKYESAEAKKKALEELKKKFGES
jgi:hypothetical protein